MSHIPGPWDRIPQTDGSQLIAHLSDPTGRKMRIIGFVETRNESAETDMANARLISAAPDLLAACKEALCVITHTGLPGDMAERMKAAIAKAESKP